MLNIAGTEFEKYHNSLSLKGTVIVSITNGTSTWLIGETDMHLTDGHVYPLLKSVPDISESIDIFKKNWAVSNVKLTASNLPFKINSSGVWVTLSDDIGDILSNDIEVYYAVGENITQLSDMLLRYSGTILEHPKYDSNFISFTGIDKGKGINKILPQNLVGDSYASAPYAFKNKKIPIVYGSFDADDTFVEGSGLGLAVAIPTNSSSDVGYVISNHVLNALTEVYATDLEHEDPVKHLTTTLTADDSGNGTAIGGRIVESIIALNNIDYSSYYFPADLNQSDWLAGVDRDLDSETKIFNKFVTGSAGSIASECLGMFGTDKESFLAEKALLPDCQYKISTMVEASSGSTITASNVRLYYKTDLSISTATLSGASNQTPIAVTFSSGHGFTTGGVVYIAGVLGNTAANGFWSITLFAADTYTLDSSVGNGNYTSGGTAVKQDALNIYNEDSLTLHASVFQESSYEDLPIKEDSTPYMVGIHAVHRVSDSGGSFDMLDLTEARLFLKYQLQGDKLQGWAACDGREYNSWISSRSSNYASGNVITDPSGIIESILRDELGVITADIEESTFIDAENTSIVMRINLHSDNENTSDKIIKSICEQSTFTYFTSGVSKHKLIPLNETTSTTDRVIPFSHIKDGKITVGKSKWLISDIEFHHQWQEEYNKFNTVINGSDGFASYDSREYTAKYKNITGASLTHIANHLLGSGLGKGSGLWSAYHNEIIFTAIGLTNADLEVGDWIELDATTVDTHIKCFGVSWSGLQFLIVNIKTGINSTKIKAIQI